MVLKAISALPKLYFNQPTLSTKIKNSNQAILFRLNLFSNHHICDNVLGSRTLYLWIHHVQQIPESNQPTCAFIHVQTTKNSIVILLNSGTFSLPWFFPYESFPRKSWCLLLDYIFVFWDLFVFTSTKVSHGQALRQADLILVDLMHQRCIR